MHMEGYAGGISLHIIDRVIF